MYLMSKKDYEAFTDQRPHLNHLEGSYVKQLLRMKIPLSQTEDTSKDGGALEKAMTRMSVSDSEDEDDEEEWEAMSSEPASSQHILASVASSQRGDDGDDDDSE